MAIPKYIPVNCELVDHIEIHATKNRLVSLEYWTPNRTAIIREKQIIKTWTTENSVEFLISENNRKIRLDYIIKLGTFKVENAHCSID